jgi:hypothetical protein
MAPSAPLQGAKGAVRAIPFYFDPMAGVSGEEAKALALPFVLNFATYSKQDFKQGYDDTGLFGFQTVWIDNSLSNGVTTLTIGGGPKQIVTAAPGSQGFYRVMGSPRILDVDVVNISAAPTVNIAFINADLYSDQWQSTISDSYTGSGISASFLTPYLFGGRYALAWSASALTSVTISKLMPDGVTYVAVVTAATTTSGSMLVDLPPGIYQITLVGVTAFQYSLAKVPAP